MKKIQFIISAICLSLIAILATASFIICFIGFTSDSFHNIDLGALAGFDVAFWLSGYILAPIVRECYDEWKEEV